MKTLVLVRHAKSDKDVPGKSDFERPLNNRGEKDAADMARRFARKNIKPDYILSSPSVRTYATVKYFAKELGFPIENVVTDEAVYFSNALKLIRILQKLGPSVNCAMLVGHNPDITVLVDRLTGQYIENVPTCGIAVIDFDVESWDRIDDGSGMLRHFDHPKHKDE